MRQLLLIIAISTVVSACSVSPSENSSAPPWAAHVSYDGQWVEVIDVRTWRSTNTGMELMLRIKSNAFMDRTIRYRILWYTEDGRPIKTVLGKWNERLLRPGQSLDITESSPGPKAADYRIEIED